MVAAQQLPASTQGLPNPFFAMDTATGRNLPPERQVALVKELGYAGIACDIAQMPAMLKAADEAKVKLFAVYAGANMDEGKPKYDPRLPEVIKSLKGRETYVWLFITGGKPSGTERDEQAVAALREVADMAAEAGLGVSLYPHAGFYVQSVGDALRLVAKAERKNISVTFNLCHFLKVDDERNLEAVLEKARPRLSLVTINGADSGGKDWDTLIQTLDRGTFDNVRLLKKLKALDYRGPIGFQGYGIKDEPREMLTRTMRAWTSLSARAAETQP
jgi:sugar phosphate isomerase/epimerase